MRRRDFILAFGGSALWSAGAAAQSTSVVLGVLDVSTEEGARRGFAVSRGRLAEMGYVEGRNLTIEYRCANYQQEQLSELARELVGRGVNVIAALGGPPTVAAKAVTTSVPIIFRTGFDPVASGYVETLHQPGANITGVFILNPPLMFKRLELLHELVPAAKSVAFFYTATGDQVSENFYRNQLRQAAESLGFKFELFSASHVDELDGLFARAADANCEAIVVNEHAVYGNNAKFMVELAARYKLPVIYPARFYAAAGGLVSYGSDGLEVARQHGEMIGLVLKGEKPRDLPVRQVTKFQFAINAKTAKSLDLEIPLPILSLAEVIE